MAERLKNHIFKLCYFIVIIVLIIQTLIIFAPNVQKEKTWQDYAVTTFEQGVEKDENGNDILVNYISTPEQLAGAFSISSKALSADSIETITGSNANFVLKNSINLKGKSWSPNKFDGIMLDGNFNTISNLTISTSSGSEIGFISSTSATIKNIVFSGVNINYNKANAEVVIGGVVAKLNSGGKLQNIMVTDGTVSCAVATTTTLRRLGGIVGWAGGAEIVNCINHATLSNGGHMGGIVGVLSESSSISNSFNYGTISANTYAPLRIGGIVGEVSTKATKVEMCYNQGEISANSSTYVFGLDVAVGGIVGYCYIPVSLCENAANINVGGGGSNSTIHTAYVGGICGITSSSVQNCFNSASEIKSTTKKITVTQSSLKEVADQMSARTNGFIAVPYGGGGGDDDDDVTILYENIPDINTDGWEKLVDMVFCTGIITIKRKVETNGSVYNNFVGGVVGCADGATISNCLSYATITSDLSKEEISYKLYVDDYDINMSPQHHRLYPDYKFTYNYYTQRRIAWMKGSATVTNCYSSSSQTFTSNIVDNTDEDAIGYTSVIALYMQQCVHHTDEKGIVNIWGYINEYNHDVDIWVTLQGYNSKKGGTIELQEYGINIDLDNQSNSNGNLYTKGSGLPANFSSNIWANSDSVRSDLHLKSLYLAYVS